MGDALREGAVQLPSGVHVHRESTHACKQKCTNTTQFESKTFGVSILRNAKLPGGLPELAQVEIKFLIVLDPAQAQEVLAETLRSLFSRCQACTVPAKDFFPVCS
jgi:hypothetical protein